jgi:hypothetical protein
LGRRSTAHVHTDVMRLSVVAAPSSTRGVPLDLNITRGVKVARRLLLCVQDAWHREEAVDVGDGAEAPPKARDNADSLVSCAAADGLLLQPISTKDRAPDSSAIRIAYGSSHILPSTGQTEDEDNSHSQGRSIEAYGVVGKRLCTCSCTADFLT